MANKIDSPDLINILIDNPNSVLVIEDAKELLRPRDKGSNSSISMLLNLTDGILGESLGIQVVCTFNTQVSNIDKALLRKGRLLAMYEFKELTVDKANALFQKLGMHDHKTDKAIPLAEIYKACE